MDALGDLLGFLDAAETTLVADSSDPKMNETDEIHTEVNNRISDLESELESVREKEATVKAELQRVLSTTTQEMSELKARLAGKVKSQKAKYNAALTRHQALHDGLVRERGDLMKQHESISKRAEAAREETARRRKEIEAQTSERIAQERELAVVNERTKQQKILEQRTREIKEATVRGLEPELQSLIFQQKQEIEAIKAERGEALRTVRESSERRYEEERQRLIEQLERERQTEFEAMEVRLQRQLQRERELHKAEIDRLALKLKAVENDRVKAIQSTVEENDQLLAETKERWKAELATERLRTAQEIEKIDVKVEKTRRANAIKRDAIIAAAEEKIREEMEAAAKQRNERKIQVVVKKLERETNEIRQKLEEESEANIATAQTEARKTLERLMKEKENLEDELRDMKRKIEDEKVMCQKLDDQNDILTNEIEEQRQRKTEVLAEIAKKEREVRETREANLQREIEARATAEEEKRALNEQFAAARVAFQEHKDIWAQERQNVEHKNQTELEAISRKVKGLLESKEHEIQRLKEQLSIAQSRLREIEDMFRRQKSAVSGSSKM